MNTKNGCVNTKRKYYVRIQGLKICCCRGMEEATFAVDVSKMSVYERGTRRGLWLKGWMIRVQIGL